MNGPMVRAPAAPELKPVKADPKTTALLMLDFMPANCGKNDRCLATFPAMKALLERARIAKVPVIYSVIANHHAGRRFSRKWRRSRTSRASSASPDKFIRTDLEKILKDKGIATVITVGTAANGAVPCSQPAARRSAA